MLSEFGLGDFDYTTWMKYISKLPLSDSIYYSNGIIATIELGDRISRQELIAVQNSATPDVMSCRLPLIELDTVCAYDFSIQQPLTGSFDGIPNAEISYCGDRVVYNFKYHSLLDGFIEEYIPWNSNSLIHRIVLTRPPKGNFQDSRIRFAVRVLGRELRQVKYNTDRDCLHFFNTAESFHVVVKSDKSVESYAINPSNLGIPTNNPYRTNGEPVHTGQRISGVLGFLFPLELDQSIELNVVFAVGQTEGEAMAEAERVLADNDKFSQATKKFWNDFYSSCPLVVPKLPITYVNQASGQTHSILPEELVKSELWNWRGLLANVSRGSHLKCSPITIADWGQFIGMWANDGIEAAVALSYTNQWKLAKECIVNWFRYAVNYKKGDGHCVWTLYPSGLTNFDHRGKQDEETEGVPFQGRVLGQYVRTTGDATILDMPLGEKAQNRSVWQQLQAYEKHLLEIRDIDGDHLLDWFHMYETGWDNKHSPFMRRNETPTTAVNEQVFRLWSLSELVYLTELRGFDPKDWEREMERVRAAVERKLWSDKDKFYHDYDIEADRLWSEARNLDAFYWLYYEQSKERIAHILERLRDPSEFSASLLPTLSMSNPDFRRDGYWDGRAWPREHSYVGVALSRAGYACLGFEWVARAITANLGPILPETLDPLADPVEQSFVGSCRLMSYNALNCLALVDIAGLQMWAGKNLTLSPHSDLPRLCVMNQKWNGKSYDAIIDPSKGITLYQNDRELAVFGNGAVYELTSIHNGEMSMRVDTRDKACVAFPVPSCVYMDGELVKEAKAGEKIHVDKGRHKVKITFNS
jgi:hypothetical protein